MDKNEKKDKGIRNIFEALTFVPQMSLSFVVPIFLGVLAGDWLDKKLGTGPIFTLIMIVLGIVGGTMSAWHLFQAISKKDDK